MQINDYSAELQPVMTPQGLAIQVAWDPRSELKLAYDDKDSKWTADELKQFDKGTEELHRVQARRRPGAQHREARRARRPRSTTSQSSTSTSKPAGLSADLKAGDDFLDNAEARKDLRSLGFATVPARDGGDGQELISSEGEVIVTMNDGVEYVLRFGDLRMDTSGKDHDATPADADRRRQSQGRRQERAALPVRHGPLQRRRDQEAGARRTAAAPRRRRRPPRPPNAEHRADEAAADDANAPDRRRRGRRRNHRSRRSRLPRGELASASGRTEAAASRTAESNPDDTAPNPKPPPRTQALPRVRTHPRRAQAHRDSKTSASSTSTTRWSKKAGSK